MGSLSWSAADRRTGGCTSVLVRHRTFFVPGAGFEPARPEGPRILSPLRLPIPSPGQPQKLTVHGSQLREGWLPPVGVHRSVGENAGRRAVEWIDSWRGPLPCRVVAARRVVGVMSVQAFEARTLDAGDAPCLIAAVSRVPDVSVSHTIRQLGGLVEQPLRFDNPSGSLDSTNPCHGERAGQPVPRRKRRAIFEGRRHPRHNGEAEMTADDNIGLGARRPSYLGGDDRPCHGSRSCPVRKSVIGSHQWRCGTSTVASGTVGATEPGFVTTT